MIELIINCNVTKSDNEINRLIDNAERLRLDNAQHYQQQSKNCMHFF